MLDDLQTWWQNTTPETRAALGDGGVVLAALLGGYLLGSVVARTLRARCAQREVPIPRRRSLRHCAQFQ